MTTVDTSGAIAYTSGTALEIAATLATLDGAEVALVIERPARQVITSDHNDETVIRYQERSETFQGVLWGVRVSGSHISACVGTRSVQLTGTDHRLGHGDRYSITAL